MSKRKPAEATPAHKQRWTAIRVSADTKAQLDQVRAIWQQQADRLAQDGLGSASTRSGREATRDVIGLDQVVRRLIKLWRRRIARAASSAKRASNNRKS